MSLEPDTTPSLVIPEDRNRRRSGWIPWAATLAVCGAAFVAWTGGRPGKLWRSPERLETLEVDRGDILVQVVENGSLESADNATVRCRVEALIGMTGGAQQQGAGARGGVAGAGGRPGMTGATPAGAGGMAAGGQPGQGGANPQNQDQAKAQQKTKSKPGSKTAKPRPGTPKVGSAAAQQAVAAATGQPSAAGGGQAGSGGAAGGAGGNGTGTTDPNAASTNAIQRPVIRSFTYQVQPYMPLKPQPNPQQAQQTKQQAPPPDPNQQQRNRGGQPQMPEKPGASRIISILPEGTRVQKGDVVCELDSSAFRDEVQAQKIRYAQAKAFVEQARAILEVNEISLREYRDGIYPQDVQLIRQYITTCEIEDGRARRALKWGQETAAKGYRSRSQVNADVLAAQQADIALREARGMLHRLEQFTGPKVIKALQAKSQAIRADMLSLASSFQLETDRLRRLEAMVEYCTMRAPRDGIVAYFVQSNRWGRVENQVQEGITVREGQPIFNVPNPKDMLVKALINESKVAMIQPGQDALIRVDAFPDRPLEGKVTEVTPIPAPLSSMSDVRVYFATVRIKSGGFDELRPGLSAEVAFDVDTRHNVVRVPLRAVRWQGDQTIVAVATPRASGSSRPWSWRQVSLGRSDDVYAEVREGLEPGERVVADPESLPAPSATRRTAPTVARADTGSK